VSSPQSRFHLFRRSIARAPRLVRHLVRARGLEFAVFTTPPVEGATPLLCINGGLIFDHTLLWPALSPLAAGRQLVFYDQRGRGASQSPPGPRAARLEHDAGDVAALRESLGIARWDVLGHSWGGGLAMLAVAEDVDGARRLVLVDAVGPTSDWMAALQPDAIERLDGDARAALERFGHAELTSPDPVVQSEWSRALYPAWFADRELARRFSPPRSSSVTGAAVAARLRAEGYDWRKLIRALRLPTLVIHGQRDLLPPTVAGEIAALVPGARLALVPDSGHMPFWEQPELFFPLVEQFLSDDETPPR
jgi:proline iminopeptidase